MNVAMLQQTSSTPKKQLSQNTNEPNRDQSFASQLADVSNPENEPQAASDGQQTTQESQDNVDLEKLEREIEAILDELPLEAGFINEEILQHPEIKALLTQLTTELAGKLEALFQGNQSIEAILDKVQKWQPLEKTVAMMISVAGAEKKTGQALMTEQFKRLAQQLTSNDVADVNSMSKLLSQPVKALSYVDSQTRLRLTSINRFNYNDKSEMGQSKVIDLSESMLSKFDPKLAIKVDNDTGSQKLQQVVNLTPTQSKSGMQQQFIEQFQKVMQQSKFSSFANGNSQLMLKLNPAHLGSLSIKLIQTNGEMAARIIASTQSAKELIEGNLSQLRHVFAAQNIQVEKFELNLQNQQQFQQTLKDQQGESQGKQQEKQENTNDDNHEQSFAKSFEDELVNLMT
ncbi:flagellar hook-length control protein FliK [Bacillus solimangrovi]|uniref:Flagellar hook-length control protein-like C-terminal domain-containing protein n=1 Tax=Bacillus solimangrovi TaxID=1305675 RepID=A0A1E5LB05_9BACI|nr:flagellar hook-length control protein FliK [Bacillus solimangrovi]OEH91264.1 hypothetical protein BFG57_06500 [Bacillus solimangrovi]